MPSLKMSPSSSWADVAETTGLGIHAEPAGLHRLVRRLPIPVGLLKEGVLGQDLRPTGAWNSGTRRSESSSPSRP